MQTKPIAKKTFLQGFTILRIMLLTDKGYFYLDPPQPMQIPDGATIITAYQSSVTPTPPKQSKPKKKAAEKKQNIKSAAKIKQSQPSPQP